MSKKSTPKADPEKRHDSSSLRQDFAGSGGAFSNFFQEMALDTSCVDDTPVFPMEGFGVEDDEEILSGLSNFRDNLYGRSLPNHDSSHDDGMGPLSRSLNICSITYARSKKPKILHNRYLLGDTIGKGSYGKVKDCLDMLTLKRYALKIVSRMQIRKIPGGMQNVEKEIRLMRCLEHTNVVRLINDFIEGPRESRCMVLEYCVGSIHDLQANGTSDCNYRRLPEWQAYFYFSQLIEGVSYLHSRHIVHKDLKPGNMLLTEHEVVKITDFGVSERLDPYSCNDMVSIGQTTPAIQPPEVALGKENISGFQLDVYGCGVSLYFMLVGAVPFNHPNILLIFDLIAAGKYEIPDYVSEQPADLIRGLMEHDPEKRLTLIEASQHVWFRKPPPPPYLNKVDLLEHLFPEKERNCITVVSRLETYYGLDALQDEDECANDVEITLGGQQFGHDVIAMENSFHNLNVNDCEDEEVVLRQAQQIMRNSFSDNGGQHRLSGMNQGRHSAYIESPINPVDIPVAVPNPILLQNNQRSFCSTTHQENCHSDFSSPCNSIRSTGKHRKSHITSTVSQTTHSKSKKSGICRTS